MKIGEKEYSEILVTDSEDHLLASITDEDIIAEKDCKVVCVPVGLEKIETCKLVEELKKREGVETHIAEPYKDLAVNVNGPAVVLVVTD